MAPRKARRRPEGRRRRPRARRRARIPSRPRARGPPRAPSRACTRSRSPSSRRRSRTCTWLTTRCRPSETFTFKVRPLLLTIDRQAWVEHSVQPRHNHHDHAATRNTGRWSCLRADQSELRDVEIFIGERLAEEGVSEEEKATLGRITALLYANEVRLSRLSGYLSIDPSGCRRACNISSAPRRRSALLGDAENARVKLAESDQCRVSTAPRRWSTGTRATFWRMSSFPRRRLSSGLAVGRGRGNEGFQEVPRQDVILLSQSLRSGRFSDLV